MALLVVNSNTPMNYDDPLISFRVRGDEVAALYPDGTLITQGDSLADRVVATQYLTQSYASTTPAGSPPATPVSGGMGGPVDGGQF
jgi:hypothetical protein